MAPDELYLAKCFKTILRLPVKIFLLLGLINKFIFRWLTPLGSLQRNILLTPKLLGGGGGGVEGGGVEERKYAVFHATSKRNTDSKVTDLN